MRGRRGTDIGRRGIALVLACILISCATTGALSERQKQLRAESVALEETRYAALVIQGMLLGGGTAAGVAAAFCKGERSECVPTVIAAFLVGAYFGAYYAYSLAKKAEVWASAEARMAQLRQDLVSEIHQLESYHGALQQVVREHQLRAQQLEIEVRLGKLSRAEARRRLASARADYELTEELLQSEQRRSQAMEDEMKQARAMPAPPPSGDLAAVERDRAALIAALRAIVAEQEKLERELPI